MLRFIGQLYRDRVERFAAKREKPAPQRYELSNWEKSQRFLTDGALPIDNGLTEWVIRDLATEKSTGISSVLTKGVN
ncbi:hypothetical protein JW979_11390 [bacterium]|nr:hypothetical protein [candidate division CSSED10-310 bacterium]